MIRYLKISSAFLLCVFVFNSCVIERQQDTQNSRAETYENYL